MCVWIPVITAAVGVANAIAGQQAAKANNAMLEYNAQVAKNNATVSRQEASYAKRQAEKNAAEKGRETAALMGSQRANMGASGALVSSGSFLDVTLSTAEEGAKDALALLEEGDREAWLKEIAAGNYEREAEHYLASRQDTGAVLASGLLQAGASTAMSALSMGAGSTFSGAAGLAASDMTRSGLAGVQGVAPYKKMADTFYKGWGGS